MRRVIGIDPGATGAIVAVDREGEVYRVSVFDMPTVEVTIGRRTVNEVHPAGVANVLSILNDGAGDALVCVEKVGAMPGQGVSSMFTFGRAAGILEGAVAALDLRVLHVWPAQWRKTLRVRAGKDGSRARATELLPGSSNYFLRVKDHGRADAALIALYGHKEAF